MMISYPGLSKLKTKPVVYEDVIAASDSGTLEQLKELSTKRKAIEDSINDSTFITEAIAREMSGGLTSRCEQDIQKLEKYLPLLDNLIHHVIVNAKSRQVMHWITEFKLRWSSVLSMPPLFHFQGPKLYQVNDIYFELGMSLFLYGSLLREQALDVLSSDLVQSATLFRKAAGVYSFAAHELHTNLSWTQERPPEAISSVLSVMSLVCLADAQAVSARKAQENGNTGGLLAKLHCGVADLLVEAINILQGATNECKDISPRFLDFLLCCKTLHELTSYKYHVQGLRTNGNIGIGIGILRWALAKARKIIPKEESWRLVYHQVIDELDGLLQEYEHENGFVWHEKIPYEDDELPLPQAVRIVSPLLHNPQKWERALMFKL
ncbi:BRO1 domain-containing protein BROX [Salvia divinorum]|uniref:BRO1 domain-containing protein BROX n=1 Tax=Salvia divinorum TaxID=28513 RepID=A0ABD1IIC4_SALDI